jgi:hypothetical protein
MGIAGWGWNQNWVRRGQVTAGSEVAGLGVGNLQNDHGSASMGWQTVGTSSWLEIGGAGMMPWRAFLLARTNLTSSATMRWRVRNDANAVVYDSGVVLAGVVPGIGQALHVLQAQVAGAVARCDISDPGNPDGFLNIALAYGGPLTQTALNIGWGGGLGRTQGGSDTRARGGSTFPRLDWSARTRDVEHNSIVDGEIWPFVMDLDLYARRGGNVLLIPDPDSPNAARETIFGRLTATSPITFPNNTEERCAWRATIEERL